MRRPTMALVALIAGLCLALSAGPALATVGPFAEGTLTYNATLGASDGWQATTTHLDWRVERLDWGYADTYDYLGDGWAGWYMYTYTLTADGDASTATEAAEVAGVTITLDQDGDFNYTGIVMAREGTLYASSDIVTIHTVGRHRGHAP